MTRLDKLITASGRASRREAVKLIKSGRVTVNGMPAMNGDEKYEDDAVVYIDGEEICCEKFRYIMLNKPKGVLSATEDNRQGTVIDLLSKDLQKLGLFPVGRLDKDTTGLLILTNDGDYAHRVISPKHNVAKRYLAQTAGRPTAEDALEFAAGVELKDGTRFLPAGLEIMGENTCIVTVFEGKFHQVRRMLAHVGKPVEELKRISIGGLRLDKSLAEGEYRELTHREAQDVFN